MKTTTAKIRTSVGREVEAKKLAIFAETDQNGDVFYKTEAQNLNNTTAVSFTHEQEEAIEEFTKRLRVFLAEQTSKLLNTEI